MAINIRKALATVVSVIVGRQFSPSEVQVPPGKGSKEFWKSVVNYQFTMSLIGLYGGLACIVIGILMFLNGMLHGGAWTADAFGVAISDAAPGTVLFLIGLGLAQINKFTVKIHGGGSDGLTPGSVLVVARNAIWQRGVEVPGENVDDDFWKMVVRYQFYYAVAGFIAGFACIIAGVLMFLDGFIGTPHWTAEVLGMKFSDAAPGTVLFFIGLGFVYLTQFSVEIAQPHDPNPPQTETGENPTRGTDGGGNVKPTANSGGADKARSS